jgi:5-methylcytosine-specific restriction endonuclease McrA
MKSRHYDKARRAANSWRQWYSTPAWQVIRQNRLRIEPCCRMCAEAGVKTKATTVDHVHRHRGNHSLFFDFRNTQSLCKRCHDSTKQAEEVRGYSTKIGADGLPADPRHPFNR